MRIVTDTNTAVSGLLWQGPPRQLIDFAGAKVVMLYTSQALLNELDDVIHRDKFGDRLRKAGLTADEMFQDYARLAEFVEVATSNVPRVVANDADDDHVIACAVAAQAQIIVSGDRHLLSLGSHHGIAILNAAQAVEKIGSAT